MYLEYAFGSRVMLKERRTTNINHAASMFQLLGVYTIEQSQFVMHIQTWGSKYGL